MAAYRRRVSLPPTETRAEIARRRLAELTAAFEAEPGDPPPVEGPGPRHLAEGRFRRRLRLHDGHLRVLVTLASAAGVLLTWWLLSERPRTSDPEPVAGLPSATSAERSDTPATPGRVVVDVAGKVRRPGIVTLPTGSRVHQALGRAGGARRGVDLSTINLARELTDGEQIVVGVPVPPGVAGSAVPVPPGVGTAGTGGPVHLNTATLEQLDTLPGVGPVTAQAIVDWRAENGGFTTVEDLLDVTGIGEATLADLRDLVTV